MRRHLAASAALGLTLLACTPAEPEHPLGASCTWPDSVDVDGDGVGILLNTDGDDVEIALIDVDTAAVRARCTGLSAVGYDARYDVAAQGGPVGYFPVLSPDLRHAVTPEGVVDLVDGTIAANPDPGWPAVALAGDTTVLRLDRARAGDGGARFPDRYCLAPRFDSPQSECAPLSGSGTGLPVVRTDATVGWAPATPARLTMSVSDGRTVTAHAFTDGVDILRFQLTDPAQGYSGDVSYADSRRTGWLSGSDPGSVLGLGNRLTWYTTDPATATGHIRFSPYSRADAAAFAGVLSGEARSGAVVEDGRALLLVVSGFTEVAIVRVEEAGLPTVVLRYSRNAAATDTPAVIRGNPVVLTWPDGPGGSPL